PAQAPRSAAQPAGAAAQGTNPPARQFFHQATPPQPRPSFEQQQKAIQTTDPGRPLDPQQMENLRQNRPAGPPQQRETPHAPPAPRAEPAPRSQPAPKSEPSKPHR
ncbi:MAG: hypothetical protein WBY53_11865, partial [Acidobacteriaceae bacterium]